MWRSRTKHRTLPADVQTTPGTETDNMRSNNKPRGKTARIFGELTEDSQICCGDWHSSVKGERQEEDLHVDCELW